MAGPDGTCDINRRRCFPLAYTFGERILTGAIELMPADKSDLEKMVEAIIAGALDYLETPLSPEKVQMLVADAASRKNLRRRENANRQDAQDLVAGLTTRERETLELVTRGLSSKAIARELGISPRTVEVHRANAFEKINASSTADAIRIGVHAGLDRHD